MMTVTRVAPTRLPVSPAVSPGNLSPRQEDELVFMRDKRYGLHGEILMLVLVASFSLFLVVLVAFPCMKRSRNSPESGVLDSPSVEQQRNYYFPWLKKSRRVDGDAPGECQLQCSNEISRKFPL